MVGGSLQGLVLCTKDRSECSTESGLQIPTMEFLDPKKIRRRYRGQYLGGRNLDSAIMSAPSEHYYAGTTKLDILASRMIWSISRAHALIDGNKRASIELTDEFLAMNQHQLKGSEDALYEVAMAAATRAFYFIPPLMQPLIADGAPEQAFAARYPAVLERLA